MGKEPSCQNLAELSLKGLGKLNIWYPELQGTLVQKPRLALWMPALKFRFQAIAWTKLYRLA